MLSPRPNRLLSALASLTAALVLGGTLLAVPARAADEETLPVSPAKSLPAKDVPTDRFVVKFKDKAGISSKARGNAYGRTAKELGVSVKELRATATGARVIETGEELSETEATELVTQLEADPAVEFAEPDQRMQPAAAAPNDEFYGLQWDFHEARAGMRVPGAWDISRGDGVVVAVVDTGITAHSDLDANVLPGYDMMTDPAMSRDGDGRDANPWDEGDWYGMYECGDNDWESSSSWHGTHVAGTIAAVTGNGKGVAGVAPGAKILPVRALGTCGGYMSDIADSVIWSAGGAVPGVPANANPARVINLSLGGFGLCSATSQSAINYAVNAGSAVVVAAGNENMDASWSNPANCENVITVAASGREGNRAAYSNYGSRIDVTAPGGDMSSGMYSGIASTLNDGLTVPTTEGYYFYQGTSMAAPHVAGVAALILAARPAWTPAQVETQLKTKSRTLTGTCAEGCGAGLVDATAALFFGHVITPTDPVVPEPTDPLPLTPGTPVINGTPAWMFHLTVDPGDWGPAPVSLRYQWYADDQPIYGATTSHVQLGFAHVGSMVSVKVTGTKTGYASATRTAGPVGPVMMDGPIAPPNITPTAGDVTVTGTPQIGGALTVDPGVWSPAETKLAYQWNRDSRPIPGADGMSYAPTPEDLGSRLSVTVTGTYNATDTVVTSTPTEPVLGPDLESAVPVISGTAKVGDTLTATPGTWTDGAQLDYQWKRNGAAIDAATAATYIPVAADAGTKLTVTVYGSKDGFTPVSRTSESTEPVAKAVLAAGTPIISGTERVGDTLAAVPGTWTDGVQLDYQWKRDGSTIDSAKAATYIPVAADAGTKLTVTVSGSKDGFEPASRTSDPTGPVAKALLTAGTPAISGIARVGDTLTAAPGPWSDGAHLDYQWNRDGSAIHAATADRYVPVAADEGTELTVTVSGSRDGFEPASRTSDPTTLVGKGALTAGTPVISGTVSVGSILSAIPGTWTDGTNLEYQWNRDGAAISGATETKYVPVAADEGAKITVTVTGTKSGFNPANRTSAPTAPVTKPGMVSAIPVINGSVRVGGTLTVAPGTWTDGAQLDYQWNRNSTAIEGATAASYIPGAADAGATLTVTVSGSKDGFEPASRTSAPTGPVAKAVLTAGIPTISGNPAVGTKLTAFPGTWTPGTALSYQWHRNGDPLVGATSSAYTPSPHDLGAALMVTVTGTLDGYTTTNRSSGLTRAVASGTLAASVPAISGTRKVGYALTATPGSWTAGTSLKYQWYRSGAAISGATASRYTLAAADAGKYLTVRVTGTATGYTAAAKTSASSGTIAYGTLSGAVPSISGTKKVGYTLTANAGTWTAGTTVKYQWYRGTTAISKATGRTYTATGTDAGKQLSVRVTGTKAGYTALNRYSAKTAAIAKGTLRTSAPVIKGTLRPGYTLTATPGTWASGTTLKYQWYRTGTPIKGATGKSYRLVTADRYDSIKVRVTGTKTGYTTAARYSTSTARLK